MWKLKVKSGWVNLNTLNGELKKTGSIKNLILNTHLILKKLNKVCRLLIL